MASEQEQEKSAQPRGFGEQTRGLSGEYAHEQGWGLNVEERTKEPDTPQNTDGGNDYEYGARDFGDEPVNTAVAAQPGDRIQNSKSNANEESSSEGRKGDR